MAKHKLVAIGDSFTQGFMSGAIYRTDLSYPVMVAHALGAGRHFSLPDFSGAGGLPINIELVLDRLRPMGPSLDCWWELVPAARQVYEHLDKVEDHWERGAGSRPWPEDQIHHNLAVWGFQVDDAYALTDERMRRAIGPLTWDSALNQIPGKAQYRTGRRVLNPAFTEAKQDASQVSLARALGEDGGIENLVVALGANNVLGSVTKLEFKPSTPDDLEELPHKREATVYTPEHFRQVYGKLAEEISRIQADRVFVGTVPHVTIPPVSRGTPPKDPGERYFEYYTRFWIWDDEFDPDRDDRLTRSQAIEIDSFIDEYNDFIRRQAQERGWHLFDTCGLLDDLAFRRLEGDVPYEFPDGLIRALRNSSLAYLLDPSRPVPLDSRFLRTNRDDRVEKGGLFSLDGIHPTTIGSGLIAYLLIRTMADAGVDFPNGAEPPWREIVAADTLLNHPPPLLTQLQHCLAFLHGRGVLGPLLRLF